MNSFSKTSYSKPLNFNNFFQSSDFDTDHMIGSRDQKRTASAANSMKPRMDKYTMASRRLKDSPYYSKDTYKKSTATTSHTKPILSSFKKQEGRIGRATGQGIFQQTSTNFQAIGMRHHAPEEDRMYETATDGFIKLERPMSKQQPRNRGSIQPQRQQAEQLFQSGSNYIESDAQDVDDHDRNLVRDIENDSLFMDRLDIGDRPQTSKGFRKKSNTNQMTFQDDGDDLLEVNERPPCRKKVDFGLTGEEELKIPIKLMYTDGTAQPKRFMHPISAHFRHDNAVSTNFKKKKVDDLIKCNVSSIRKSTSQISVPFETSIDPEFLSLFASTNQEHMGSRK